MEIERAQKERQYQRNMRKTEINQDIIEQKVEEISPSGAKRQIGFSEKR